MITQKLNHTGAEIDKAIEDVKTHEGKLNAHDMKLTAHGKALAGKVDQEPGKGLSTNDYTTEEKTKVATSVLTSAQELSPEQQKQARENIQATSKKELSLSAQIGELRNYSGLQYFENVGFVYNRDGYIAVLKDGVERVYKNASLSTHSSLSGSNLSNAILFTVVGNNLYVNSSTIFVIDLVTGKKIASVNDGIAYYNRSLFTYGDKLYSFDARQKAHLGIYLWNEIDIKNHTVIRSGELTDATAFFGRENHKYGEFIYSGNYIYNIATNEFYKNDTDFMVLNKIMFVTKGHFLMVVANAENRHDIWVVKNPKFDALGKLTEGEIYKMNVKHPNPKYNSTFLRQANNTFVYRGFCVKIYDAQGDYYAHTMSYMIIPRNDHISIGNYQADFYGNTPIIYK